MDRLKQKVYSQTGADVGEVMLSADIFNRKLSPHVVSEVVVALQKNARMSKAHTKDRSDVRGGGVKPWRQKGTGRARHGSIRSPIWKGGGVTHGPRKEKKYEAKVNKQVKKDALRMTLSAKLSDGEIVLVDKIDPKTHQTKEFISIIKTILGDKKNGKTAVIVEKKNENMMRSSSNIPGVYLIEADNLNIIDALSVKYLILTKGALEILVNRLS